MPIQIIRERKLDSFSKILLATGAINQMAGAINDVASVYRVTTPTFKERLEEHDAALDNAVTLLSVALEQLAEYMNGCDMVSPIDAQMTDAACKIILLGRDNVKGYER